jgi:uncharacterized membrane protein
VKATPDPIAQYLLRLADGLEALGPDETREILTEIRTHLAEALAEAGGDEAAALADFDDPEALASRILEERGIISGEALPAAPTWMRVAAQIIDVAVWLLVSFLLTPVAWVIASLVLLPFHVAHGAAMTAVGYVMLVLLACLFGWFFWLPRRNKRGYVSTGMAVLGLRRVQVGSARRTARKRQIPSLPKTRMERAGAIWTAFWVLLILGGLIYTLASQDGTDDKDRRESIVVEVSSQSTWAASNVGDIYRMVMTGGTAQDIKDAYRFTDPRIVTDLLARKASGSLASYVVSGVELPEPDQFTEPWKDAPPAFDYVVRVSEYAAGSDFPAAYDYRLRMEMHDGMGEMQFVSCEKAQ